MVTRQQVQEDGDRWIGAMNAHDLARLDQLAEEMYTPDFAYHPGSVSRPRGPEGRRQMVRRILERHPNVHVTLQDAFAAGDKAAVRCATRLTDPDSGQPVDRLDLLLMRYVGRKTAEAWELLGALDAEQSPARGNQVVTVQQFHEIYDRWIEAVNAHDTEHLGELAERIFAPDYAHHPGAADRPRGPEGAKQIMRRVLEHYPNVQATLQDVFASGDRVATRSVLRLTDPTSGQSMVRMDITIQRYEGGKVAEDWEVLGELDPE